MRAIPAILIIILLLSACHATPEHQGDDRRETSSLSRKAWEMHHRGEPAEKFIALQIKAVEQMRQGLTDDNPVEVLEQLGFFYNYIGDYPSALRYYREAIDSLQSIPLNMRNEGAIQLFGDLSSLYSVVGIMDKAIEYSDSAIVESNRQNGRMLADVYRFRAGIFQANDMIPEALECYDLAMKAVESRNTVASKDKLKAIISSEKAGLLIETCKGNSDTIDNAVKAIEASLKYDDMDDAYRNFSLGLGYIKQGKLQQGLKLLTESEASFREQGDAEMLYFTDCELMDLYARHAQYEKMAQLYPSFIEATDSFRNDEKDRALIGAMIKYDLQASEDRNKILDLKLDIERDRSIIAYIITGALIIILVSCIVIFYQRNKLQRQKRIMQEHELSWLNERVGVLEKDLSAGINSNTTILSSPQLITGNSEGKFRRAFNVLYPGFIPTLKKDYPQLSTNDELLCMLLYLHHTTDEISVYLGITRASVNTARYRLRSKLGLAKEVDLDEFITSVKTQKQPDGDLNAPK